MNDLWCPNLFHKVFPLPAPHLSPGPIRAIKMIGGKKILNRLQYLLAGRERERERERGAAMAMASGAVTNYRVSESYQRFNLWVLLNLCWSISLLLYLLWLLSLWLKNGGILEVMCRKKDRDRAKDRDRDHLYPYQIVEITPPPRNLGVRCLPLVCILPIVRLIIAISWFWCICMWNLV